jgi:AsmA-like C-terminal region
MRDLIAAAAALGWNVSRGWDLSGPFACDLRWLSTFYPWREKPVGWLNFGAPGDGRGASLTAPFLNQPVGQIRAHMELKSGEIRHIELSSAAAFGARWSGTFDRPSPSAEWQFALSADSVDAADLDRWLNPVWRENFLGRMLPFLASHPGSNAVPENLRATGRLDLAEFNLGSLAVSSLKGTLAIQGRRVTFANASGQFFGGAVSGSLEADLQSVPSYRTTLDFSGVDLAALAAASAQIPDVFAGSISGHASLRASGASRSELLASLDCTGAASVENGKLKNMNLLDSLRASTRVPGATLLENASANFACHRRRIEIQDLRLVHANGEMQASGSIDFSRNLDLRLRVLPQAAVGAGAAPPPEVASYHLTGTLAAPQVERTPPPQHFRSGG